jgi:hypothetical protein
MLQTISGTYRNGKIELSEPPTGIIESQVFVTFVSPQSANTKHQLITFGMFPGVQQSTETDFEEAEFQGDADDSLDWS